jgi:hypothetical protein
MLGHSIATVVAIARGTQFRGRQFRRAQEDNTVHRTRIRRAQVFSVLRSLHADSKLVRIVTKLTREVERLDEDNAQLYASVMVYKEVLRRQCAVAGQASISPPGQEKTWHTPR